MISVGKKKNLNTTFLKKKKKREKRQGKLVIAEDLKDFRPISFGGFSI